jgi:hypothetical protein
MTNKLLIPFAKEILDQVAEGWDDSHLEMVVEKLQFLQNDTIQTCINVAETWKSQITQWRMMNRLNENDFKINVACTTVIARNLGDLKQEYTGIEEDAPAVPETKQ